MQFSGRVQLLLLIVVLWEWKHGNAKPTPGSRTRISIAGPPPPPAALTSIVGPAKFASISTPTIPIAYNAPILAYNYPLDAGTASQRVDIQQRYNYNYIPSLRPLKVIASSQYVDPRRFNYASPYAVPLSSSYYAPGYVVPLRYSAPIGPPTSPLFI